MARNEEPEGLLEVNVNGHELTGTKRNGRWQFWCPSWPAMAKMYDGAAEAGGVLAEFMGRALADAVVVRVGVCR